MTEEDEKHVLALLKEIDPLIRRLSRLDAKDGYDELRQDIVVEMLNYLQRHHRYELNRGTAVGIARNVSCDLIKKTCRNRRASLPTSGLERSESRRDRLATTEDAFNCLWEQLSCQPLRSIAKVWRKSLRPQERRALRGLRRGMTQLQVAHAEGIAPGTVASWVHRSSQRLKAMLD